MAQASEFPCDGDGICMACKKKPLSPEDSLACKTCATPWHVACLSSSRPKTLADALQWDCPDCSVIAAKPVVGEGTGGSRGSDDLITAIRAIESDGSLTVQEKAKRRQELMCKGAQPSDGDEGMNPKKETIHGDDDVVGIFDNNLYCSFCMQLPERPVTVRSFVFDLSRLSESVS